MSLREAALHGDEVLESDRLEGWFDIRVLVAAGGGGGGAMPGSASTAGGHPCVVGMANTDATRSGGRHPQRPASTMVGSERGRARGASGAGKTQSRASAAERLGAHTIERERGALGHGPNCDECSADGAGARKVKPSSPRTGRG